MEAVTYFGKTPLRTLPLTTPFAGIGVYALYVTEVPHIYADITGFDISHPIYVGKAVAPGWRQGRSQAAITTPTLFRRLREHAKSVEDATNLDITDFRTRFMLMNGVERDLIAPVEAALIRLYQPMWNVVIDGFGNHDPGKGRYEQALSDWDTLHPGRPWTARILGERPNVTDIKKRIQTFLES